MKNLPDSLVDLAERHKSDVDGDRSLTDAELAGLFLNALAAADGYDHVADATGAPVRQAALCAPDNRALKRYLELRDDLGQPRDDLKDICVGLDPGDGGGGGR